ncbi:tripartite tricarboxylate transporter substrate binding protein [Roseomonas sp. OT10]|uniref:Bug family tripartite tricarboxylate transporter substrate binding protein n=1 Tax=Roseomonas cutis TaxID=2897332 RepID=UPI001E345B12|nr:tripartite tricarboxylate transporter substrate binding protein [Roseomonas sp. OT10]UFN51301.1 tripartite tricarboxylate transporter substrate binding protein [Roseomonas sp. OT10]
MLSRRQLAGAVLLASAMAGPAHAQAYPDRPVTLVVPWGPGGSTDVIGRLLAQRLAPELGQPVVVENRAGANGTIGTASVVRARPDGHTLLLGTSSTYAMAPHLMDLPYDNDTALAPVGRVVSVPMMILVNAASPAKDLAEFVARTKAARPPMTYASSGTGSSTFLATEMFLQEAGVEMLEVAYRTGPATTASVLSGENPMLFMSTTNGLALVRSGQLRALAIATPQRSPVAPEIPTFAEQGYPGFEAYDDLALFAPAGTPEPILDRLNAMLAKALASPEIGEKLSGLGLISMGGPRAEFPAYFARENARWRQVIRSRNIRIQ